METSINLGATVVHDEDAGAVPAAYLLKAGWRSYRGMLTWNVVAGLGAYHPAGML